MAKKVIFLNTHRLSLTKPPDYLGVLFTQKELKGISTRIRMNNGTYTGINILNEENLKLFSEISKGEHLINGFSNKNIRKNIFKYSVDKIIINKTTRILAKLKAHGIIKKVFKKNKYYLTTKGRKIINSILIYTKRELLT